MSGLFDITCSHKSNIIEKFLTKNPIFVCVISYTETSQVPGITFAGANPDLIKYTPAADSEFLYHGRCFSISGVPATPIDKNCSINWKHTMFSGKLRF